MARAPRSRLLPTVIAGVVALALLIAVLKWLLITAAILAVPFLLWWLYDRNTARSRQRPPL